MASPIDLRARLPELMLRDAHRLGRRLDGVRGMRNPGPRQRTLATIAAEERLARRQAAVPRPRYPDDLPITARRHDIMAALRDHQVVIVAGETGSGKSTQLPKMCLELGRGMKGMIGHTQPRRIAARAVAERVAEELGSTLGAAVGYAVRFTDRVSEQTLVKVMTDGLLLAEIHRDRMLTAYDTVIIDEAHERSLNIDFMLGYLTRLLPRRPDLKVVITSATINTERMADHFGGAPVVAVSGRTYPVDVRYRPLDDEGDQNQAIVDTVAALAGEGPGDVLVFLSGEREIRDAADALAGADLRETELLPLYARLSIAEQHRVFQPHRGRRIVLATNVAETSLTVPGIRYVVDPGTARMSRYNRRTKVQRLPIEKVSQASADQRAGRCGRIGPGVCVRLYSEDDYQSRPRYTDPEILRTNLASVILQMAALDLGDIASFPFVDPPDARAVKDGTALLEELGALEQGAGPPRLTPMGRRLARLPLDPRLGRMVLEAAGRGCVDEVMVIAAALTIQDPRERPADREQAATESHARFRDPDSDFVTFLNLWRYLQTQQEALSSSQVRRLCRREFLHYLRVREWQDIHAQLREAAGRLGIKINRTPGDRDAIHISLLAGLLSHIGARDGDRREFQGARNARFAIAPGSALARRPPRWVMAAELVETTRLWARIASRIQPEWAEEVGDHLITRSHSEPHWDAGRGAVMAFEKVTLYGLPVVARRRVPYGGVDPRAARDLFIRHALVEGEWPTHHRFVAANRTLADDVRAREDRARRGEFQVEDALFRFYDERVPDGVTSGRDFDAWWKSERERRPELLRLTTEWLRQAGAGGIDPEAFPDVWRQGDLELSLSYEYAPGSPTDGVTVRIPLPYLNRVADRGFDWNVPGLRRELVTELIRTLPRPLRRGLVPAHEHAAGAVDRLDPQAGGLLAGLGNVLGVDPGAFRRADLTGHLRVTFEVVDEAGAPIARGKSLGAVKALLQEQVQEAIAARLPVAEQAGVREWTVGTIPRVAEAGGVRAYPALVDEGDSVALRLLPDETAQRAAMEAGTRRLLLLTLPAQKRTVPAALFDELLAATVDQLMAGHGGPAWDEEGFAVLAASVRARLPGELARVGPVVSDIAAAADAVAARLGRRWPAAVEASVADARSHLSRLVFPGFVSAAGAARLPDVLRYVRGIERRVDKLTADPARDRERTRRLQRLEDDYDKVRHRDPSGDVRWMLEELRVSEFAQVLGTAYPVSEQRVARHIAVLEGRGDPGPRRE